MIGLIDITMYCLGYNIFKAKKQLKNINKYDNEELSEYKNKAKWKIANFHYQNNQYYKNKIGSIFPDKWEDLPIMGKTDFQESKNILSDGYNSKNVYYSWTSGSSGTPFYFAKSKYAHAMTWAMIDYYYKLHGISYNAKQARIFGLPNTNMFLKIKEKCKDFIMNRHRFPVQSMKEYDLDGYLKTFKMKKFRFIYGYANALKHFAIYIKEKKTTLKSICPSLKLCISTAEVLTEENIKIIQSAFGVPIVNEYGTSESGVVSFGNSNKMIISNQSLNVEVIKSKNLFGDENAGKIVITDYFNEAMPFVRYDLGDIVSLDNTNVSNKKTYYINKIFGRENDMVLLENGKKLPGFSIIKPIDYHISENPADYKNQLREFVLIQNDINEFRLNLDINRDLRPEEIVNFTNIIQSHISQKTNVSINVVKKIKGLQSGKIKQFISMINK